MSTSRSFLERKLSVGQQVIVAEDGPAPPEELGRRILNITAIYDHCGDDEGGSPYFDEEMESYLYEFRGFSDCLYGIELTPVTVRLPQHPRLYQVGQTVFKQPDATPWTIVDLIEPRLAEHRHPPALETGLVEIPWEYIIEGAMKMPGQKRDQLSPTAAGKCRMEVSEGLLSLTPSMRSPQKNDQE